MPWEIPELLPCLSLTILWTWQKIASLQLLLLEKSYQPIIVSYLGTVPFSFPKDFCLLPDCPLYISSEHLLCHATSCYIMGAARQTSLSIKNFWSLLPPKNFIFCIPLCLLALIFPSTGDFSTKSVLPIRWPVYWRLSFSIGPSNVYSELISFSVDWLDILVVEWTLKSLVKHQNWKVSIIWCSAFSTVQLSHPSQLLEKP